MRPDGGRRRTAAFEGIIRRILRNASMTGWTFRPAVHLAPREAVAEGAPRNGLESVKKTHQVAGGWHGLSFPARLFSSGPTTSSRLGFNETLALTGRGLTRPGYVIDDGPRNEAPRDADCGVSRRGADRPGRDVLVSQPGCPAPGGGGADPRRDRPRSGDHGLDRHFGLSRQATSPFTTSG